MANTISSRTPEGTPNRCPLCGAAICVEPVQPPGDAPCPNCGTLLWFTKMPDGLLFYDNQTIAPILARIVTRICENLGINKTDDNIDVSAFFKDLGADSVDIMELIMEFEEEFEFTIPDEEAEKIRTIRDLIDYILRRGME
jgi:acyl carrier protein